MKVADQTKSAGGPFVTGSGQQQVWPCAIWRDLPTVRKAD